MATRALVGFLDTDKPELISTYNHYDGYPENLGKGLEDHYEEPNEALKIASTGYISYMDPETGKIESKNSMPPDKVNLKGLDYEEAMYEIAKLADSYGADYVYIYNPEDYEWVNVKMYGTRQTAEELMNSLATLKSAFGPDLKNLPANPDQVAESKWKRFITK